MRSLLLALVLLVAAARPARVDAQQPIPFPFPQPTPKQEEPEEDRARDFLFPLKLDWSIWLPDPPAAWPAYDDVHAYIPTRAGEVCAISLSAGEVQWCVESETNAPLASGDRSVFVAGTDAIHALETTIGDLRWRTPVDSTFSAPLLWDSGWLVACLDGGGVIAVRGDTGETIWRRVLDATCRAKPAIGGDRLFLPLEDGRLLAVSLTSGEPIWSQQLGGAVTDVLPLGERLYTGSHDNYFYALAGEDGRILWRWRTGADIVGQPLVDRSRVFFTSRDNVVRALDRNHGAQRWKQPLPMRPLWGPATIDATLVISGLSPEIRGYSAKDGEPTGFFLAPTELAAPPHLVDGETADARRLYALTGNGEFLSLLHRVDPLVVPLEVLPGTALPIPTSLGVLPGLTLGLPPWVTPRVYLPGSVGLPQPVEPVVIVGTPIGLPPAEHDLHGRALGFPPSLPPTTLPGRPGRYPPTPYWFELRGIEVGLPPSPEIPETGNELPGQQLSLPPPPFEPPRIDLPGTLLSLPPPPPPPVLPDAPPQGSAAMGDAPPDGDPPDGDPPDASPVDTPPDDAPPDEAPSDASPVDTPPAVPPLP